MAGQSSYGTVRECFVSIFYLVPCIQTQSKFAEKCNRNSNKRQQKRMLDQNAMGQRCWEIKV